MRRIAMFSALALSIAGLAPTQAVAGDGFYGRPGFYGPPAFRPAPRRYYAPRYAVPPYGMRSTPIPISTAPWPAGVREYAQRCRPCRRYRNQVSGVRYQVSVKGRGARRGLRLSDT
jgi:hypothetical protein